MSIRFCLRSWSVASAAWIAINLISTSLQSVEPPTFFDVSGGYRFDRITCRVNSYFEPGDFESSDKLKCKSVALYTVGAKAQIALCDYWYLKGYGSYGWGNSGSYYEKVKTPGLSSVCSKADLHDNRARDYQVGFGYIYPVDGCWGCWGLGPVWGWFYHDQRVKLKNARTDGFPDPVLDGLIYKNRWSGPWLGIDAVYRHCNFLVMGGFEYHWAWWHASWNLDGHDIPNVAFSDRRRSHRAHGCVLYLDGKWEFYTCWHVGVGLKWQFFEARSGRLQPRAGDFDEVGEYLGLSNTQKEKIQSARWQSVSATLDIGYGF